MKLYVTRTSPYGRLVRVVLLETGLDARVERDFVRTRVPECPVNAFNPTGKVPTLETDDGYYLSEARLICQYLDALHGGTPVLDANPSSQARQLEGTCTGFVDGVSVWVRELRRSPEDRSASILEQERARAERCLAWLDSRVGELEAACRYVQLVVMVALDFLDSGTDIDAWRERYPAIARWHSESLQAEAVVAIDTQD